MQFIYQARNDYLLLESALFVPLDQGGLSQSFIDLCCEYVTSPRMVFERLLLAEARRVYGCQNLYETFCALVCDQLLAHTKDWLDFAFVYLVDLTHNQNRTTTAAQVELLLREALKPRPGFLCNRLLCMRNEKCTCGPYYVRVRVS